MYSTALRVLLHKTVRCSKPLKFWLKTIHNGQGLFDEEVITCIAQLPKLVICEKKKKKKKKVFGTHLYYIITKPNTF